MKRLTYTLLSILAIILVVSLALISRNTTNSINPNGSGDLTFTNDTKELQKLSVSEVTHSVFYAPQYVAINLGFFEEEGLEIELINGGGADNVMTAVLSDQVDIGFAGPEAAIYVYKEGSSDYAEVFAGLTIKDGSMLVSREKIDNFEWSDIIGKHVLPGRTGGVPYMTFEHVLREHKINPQDDLNLDTSISFDAMTPSFVGGTGDFVTVFEPTASNLEINNQGYIVAAVGEYTDEIPYTAYFAKKSYIEENTDLIERFTKAIKKGQEWVSAHTPEEIAEVVAPSFPDADTTALISSIKNYKEINVWSTSPYISEDSFNRLQDIIIEAGELEEKVPYEKIFNDKFSK